MIDFKGVKLSQHQKKKKESIYPILETQTLTEANVQRLGLID